MRFATIRELSRNTAGLVVSKKPTVITRNGHPVCVIQPIDEDMLLLADPQASASIARGRAESAAGVKGVEAGKLLRHLRKHGKLPNV